MPSGEFVKGNFGRKPGQPARTEELRRQQREVAPKSRKELAIESILELREILGERVADPKAGVSKDYSDYAAQAISRLEPEEQAEVLARVGLGVIGGDNVVNLREEQ